MATSGGTTMKMHEDNCKNGRSCKWEEDGGSGRDNVKSM